MTFEEIYRKYIFREGSEELLEWIKSTDFFSAPASTKFHECYHGGLAEHSAKVFDELIRLLKAYPEVRITAETAAIISLLHDLCKIGTYKIEYRNRKNEFGQWEKYPVYTFKEDFAYGGHGSKSVYLIQKYMKLTDEEAVAINCHMGATNNDYSVFEAYRQYPLAFLLHTADMAATIEF
jgi:hypothetical protein